MILKLKPLGSKINMLNNPGIKSFTNSSKIIKKY